jgi:hypothetical protein
VLAEDVPPAYDGKPGAWRSRLDRIFEPVLSAEEQAEKDAEQAEADRKRMEREWESWGESPEQQEAQRRFMAMAGPEG